MGETLKGLLKKQALQFAFRYGIYIYPVNFKLQMKCYEGIPSVKLVDGTTPFEGLVVLEPDSYVCYDGFTDKAAELVCGELGFSAAEEYSAHSLTSTAKLNSYLNLSCPEGSSFHRLMDCSFETTKCLLKETVRLKCRGPLGSCDPPGHVPYGHWDSSETNFGSRLTLTCSAGYAINGSETLQCVGLPGWSTYFPVWNASVPSCLRVGSLGSCDHPGDVPNGYWDSNKTNFGSRLTLTCDEGYVINGSATLQRQRPPETSNQSNDGQSQCPKETDRGVPLNPASADSGTSMSRPLPHHSKLGTLSAQQMNPHPVYQDISEVDKMPSQHGGAETATLTHEYLSLHETSLDQNDCYGEHEYSTRILK
ncbi:E-selectin-like [Diadema setosum]|uniref:E-selectin-like n=1 Tax=Diadema setosum TaxID=31175 RepID=UPI003B3BC119